MRYSKRVMKKMKKRTPGNRLAWVFKVKKHSQGKCGMCHKKLNRSKLTKIQAMTLSKTMKRPERPYPELCPRCMREKIKRMIK